VSSDSGYINGNDRLCLWLCFRVEFNSSLQLVMDYQFVDIFGFIVSMNFITYRLYLSNIIDHPSNTRTQQTL